MNSFSTVENEQRLSHLTYIKKGTNSNSTNSQKNYSIFL